MKEELKHKIFSKTDCLSEQTLFDYIDNKLNHPEQHKVEKHLLDCEFCSDALEGLQLVKNRNRINKINSIIEEKITYKKEAKIVFFNFKTVTSIAAALVLVIVSVYFFNYFFLDKNNDMAMLKTEETSKQAEPMNQEPPPPPLSETAIPSDSLLKDKENATGMVTSIAEDAVANKQTIDELTVSDKRANNVQSAPVLVEDAKNGSFAASTNEAEEINITDIAKEKSEKAKSPKKEDNNDGTVFFGNTDKTVNNDYKIKTETKTETKNKYEQQISSNYNSTPNNQTPIQPTTTVTTINQENNRTTSGGTFKDSEVTLSVTETKEGKKDKKGILKKSQTVANNNKAAAYNNEAFAESRKQETTKVSGEEQKALEQDKIVLEEKAVTTGKSVDDNIQVESKLDSTSYRWREIPPQFIGGEKELSGYFDGKLRFDETEKTDGDEDQDKLSRKAIIVELTIDKTGKAINPKIITPVDKETEKKIIELVNKMPLWKPATKDGKAIDSKHTIEIK